MLSVGGGKGRRVNVWNIFQAFMDFGRLDLEITVAVVVIKRLKNIVTNAPTASALFP